MEHHAAAAASSSKKPRRRVGFALGGDETPVNEENDASNGSSLSAILDEDGKLVLVFTMLQASSLVSHRDGAAGLHDAELWHRFLTEQDEIVRQLSALSEQSSLLWRISALILDAVCFVVYV